jgi:hypothetical protein
MIRDAGERGIKKEIIVGRSRWCGQEGKLLEVIPSGGVHPGKLRLGGLSADKTCGIGNTQSANGSDVSEKGVIDRGGNKSVINGLVQFSWRRKKDAIRSFKTKLVKIWRNGGGSTLDEQMMLRAKGFENSDSECQIRVDDFSGFKPNGCGGRLVIRVGAILFQVVVKDAMGDIVLVDIRVKRERIGIEGFRRND